MGHPNPRVGGLTETLAGGEPRLGSISRELGDGEETNLAFQIYPTGVYYLGAGKGQAFGRKIRLVHFHVAFI
jgi:hypothetical protein